MRFAAVLFAATVLSGAASAETPPATLTQPPAPSPPNCNAPEHRQLDFWVGEWDVFDTVKGSPVGQSRIEKLYDGCAIRENWSEPGYAGGSLNVYSETEHQWKQIWTDTTGSWREFVGGLDGGRMVMTWTHPSVMFPGKTARERMIFLVNPDGAVRQYSDATVDEGKTWTLRYDYIYRRKAPPPAPAPPPPPHTP